MSKQEQLDQIKNYLCSRFKLPPEQVEEMIPSFTVTLGEHVEVLEAAVESMDYEELARAGHTIKGALLNLGINDAADISLKIEQGGRDNNQDIDYAELVAQIRDILNPIIS